MRAYVEVPRGSRDKYEYDHELEALVLDRRLFAAVSYPSDYGFTRGHRGHIHPTVTSSTRWSSSPRRPSPAVSIDIEGKQWRLHGWGSAPGARATTAEAASRYEEVGPPPG